MSLPKTYFKTGLTWEMKSYHCMNSALRGKAKPQSGDVSTLAEAAESGRKQFWGVCIVFALTAVAQRSWGALALSH